MMAYKDPPKEKYHNGAPCAVIALLMLAGVAALTALGASAVGLMA